MLKRDPSWLRRYLETVSQLSATGREILFEMHRRGELLSVEVALGCLCGLHPRMRVLPGPAARGCATAGGAERFACGEHLCDTAGRSADSAFWGDAQLPLSQPRPVVAKPTTREKFVTATEDNFDYSALFLAGSSRWTRLRAGDPEFHQGMAGYGRYYWHTVADQSIENYFVEFIIPAVNHEDSRYYAMGREGGASGSEWATR